MARVRPIFTAINAGEFGPEMKSRIDFERYGLAGERVEGWLPRATGGMERSPGWEVIEEVTGDARLLGFKSTRELGYLAMMKAGTTTFYYDRAAVVNSAQVTITNGAFTGSGPTSWTDSSTGTASISGGGTGLVLTVPVASTGAARADQEFTGATAGAKHNIKVTVASGPVSVSFGSAAGASDLGSGVIDQGEHVFEVVPPSTSVFCRISSDDKSPRTVTSIESASAASAFSIANPYEAADLPNLRTSQLNDTMFIASGDKPIQSLARRGEAAFGMGLEALRNGPFSAINATTGTITPSAIDGNITLTASEPIFESGSVGKTFQVQHSGQSQAASITTENSFTDDIEISGSGTFRRFSVVVTGASGNTVTLQRSFGVTGNFEDFESYTTDQNKTIDDQLDGQIVFYRLGVKTGDYSSGTIDVSMNTSSGSTVGEVEITAFSSSTSVTARVRTSLGDTTATSNFSESVFGGSAGEPIECEFQEGRLWIGSLTRVFGSQSDDFTNFQTGSLDADAIDRRPSSQLRGLLSMGDLGVFENDAVTVASSGEFNQPYTPSNFRLRPDISRGSSFVEPVAIDSVGIYVDRDNESIREVLRDEALGRATSTSLTRLNPRITLGGVSLLQYQRAPETRVWCLKESGEVIVLTYARAENVVGWCRRPIDGEVMDIAISYGQRRDRIYALIKRTISGVDKTFLCVLASEVFTEGAEANMLDFSVTAIAPSSPSASVKPSATTGTITLAASSGVFSGGDVGKRVFVSEGQADITVVSDSKTATATVVHPLRSTKSVASGFWFMGATTTSMAGLTLLANETVTAWADGVQYDSIAVDGSGNATLPVAAAWAHVGHVQPDAVYESMKLFQGGQRGAASNGVTKRVNEVGVDLLRSSVGLKLGARSADLAETLYDPDKFVAGRMFTGEHRDTVDCEHLVDPRVYIVASGAGPQTVLSYAADYKANER